MKEKEISMMLGDSPLSTNSVKLMGKGMLGENLGSSTLLAKLSIQGSSG